MAKPLRALRGLPEHGAWLVVAGSLLAYLPPSLELLSRGERLIDPFRCALVGLALVSLGAELTNLNNGMHLRAEYDGAFSENTSSNSGMLRFSYDF